MQTQSTQTDHLKDYLGGMKRANRDALIRLQGRTDWRDLAQGELARRASRLMQVFDDAVLTAIATGEVDVNSAIADTLAD